VFGYSSGAVLALKAKAAGLAISRLALYEPPFLVDEGLAKLARDISARLTKLLSEGLRGEAVELYQTEMVDIPAEIVAQLRHAPFRPALENIAHTLVYDATILGIRCRRAVGERSGAMSSGTISDPTLWRNSVWGCSR
jgi:hypothetical protein